MKHPYPVMLNVEGCRCLVIGGGKVAERKIVALAKAGADVTVISPDVTDELAGMAARGEVVLLRKTFEPGDLASGVSDGATRCMLAIAATDQTEVNRRIHREAQRLGIPVNVVDEPQISSFIVPSVVRRGKLVIAVSTGGASPSASRKIAKELEAAYGDEYEIYLDFLGDVRVKIQSLVEDKRARQRMFKQMLEWDALGRIRSGTFGIWKDELFAELERKPDIDTIMAFSGRNREAGD